MKKIFLFVICFLTFFSAIANCAVEKKRLIQVKGVVHVNSYVSSGAHSPEYLAKMADEAGINALFLTENLKPEWEYGLFPFRNIIKKVVRKKGLLRYGAGKYERRIDQINEEFPDVTVLIAAEVAPFYYWTGHPLTKKGLTLNDWDLQFIVTGMDAEDYTNIPTVSNRRTGVFERVKYDQYHGKMGIGPYQEVIDYVNRKGGMTFWSNPEAKTNMKAGPAWFKSPPAAEYMLEAKNYTGFCCFHEGYRSIGGPGGVWDKILSDYCAGSREKPVWAIGEVSFHSRLDSVGKEIDEVQTVFLVPSNTKENILKAMRNGNMYAVRQYKKHRLQLDSFTVEYTSSQEAASVGNSDVSRAGMGEELASAGPVTVSFKISWTGQPKNRIIAKLIRNGKIIEEYNIIEPGEFEYKDSFYEPGKKVYYRLDIRSNYPNMLFSNPIFVEFE